MLLSIKECDYHVQRMLKDFTFGEIVKERTIEKSKVDDFNFRFEKILLYMIELRAITKGESNEIIEDCLKSLGKTKQQVMKLNKKANLINEDLTYIWQRLNIIADKKRKDVEYVMENILDITKLAEETEENNMQISNISTKLKELKSNSYDEDEIDMLTDDLENVISFIHNQKIKNDELEALIQKLHKRLDDALFLLKDEIELHDFVDDTSKHSLPLEVFETISKKLTLRREATMFEGPHMGDGKHLSYFKNNAKGEHRLFTYGTDKDIELCRDAHKNGVDFVAKKGIYQMSHNTFDVVLNCLNEFSFYETSDLKFTLPEETTFNFVFNRSIPKSNGYLIFNIPYFKLPVFLRKIKNNLTVESMYRVDDEIKNILFVCRYKQNKRNDSLSFKKAMLNYDKIPHYKEMNEIIVDKGELTHPKTFRPYFVDEEDILAAFEKEEATFDVVERAYKPKEKVIELNRPLQEYKEGHLPAVATIEIVNGIYDLEDEVDFPNIYSTKIVQQDIEEEQEEMISGKLTKVISQKKKNVIVSKALLPDGEIIELLNTK